MSKRNLIIAGIVLSLVIIAVAAPKIMLFLAGNAKSVNDNPTEFFITDPTTLDELANRLKNEDMSSLGHQAKLY